jgi:hypothetical protein
MVDATDLKSVVRKGVRVRVPPSAPFSLKALTQTMRVYQTLIAGNMNSYPDEAVMLRGHIWALTPRNVAKEPPEAIQLRGGCLR